MTLSRSYRLAEHSVQCVPSPAKRHDRPRTQQNASAKPGTVLIPESAASPHQAESSFHAAGSCDVVGVVPVDPACAAVSATPVSIGGAVGHADAPPLVAGSLSGSVPCAPATGPVTFHAAIPAGMELTFPADDPAAAAPGASPARRLPSSLPTAMATPLALDAETLLLSDHTQISFCRLRA